MKEEPFRLGSSPISETVEDIASQLWRLADECSEENGDGDGALALKEAAVTGAVTFLRSLPLGVPLPEIAPEPGGAVSLDWIASKTRMFSVSCGSSPRLAFSWLDGADRGHGIAEFDGRVVPEQVLQGVRAIVDGRNS